MAMIPMQRVELNSDTAGSAQRQWVLILVNLKIIFMKISDTVCTLEQAKRLKELGICQDSQCYWRRGKVEHIDSVNSWHDEQTLREMIVEYDRSCESSWRIKFELYSAFTVAELGVMHDCFSVTPGQFENKGKFGFPDGKVKGENVFYQSEAEARAQWLIIALKKGWTTVEEVNARLQSA
jgi:hypothetical protein